MKKFSKLLLSVTLLFSLSATAGQYKDEDYDKSYILPDLIIMRPLGLGVTLAGTGLFIVLSPLTAFASIAPPHDAFEKTANLLIMAPGHFTFSRPLGNKTLIDFPDP
jgi:hypothetical protein